MESAPRAYKLKVSNAAPPISTLIGTSPTFLGVGVSLVLFVLALRHLGTARTGAYFSLAPFIGALAAILLLHDPLTLKLVISAWLMGFGLWMHLSERHEHAHNHEALEHEHVHVHDGHHQHQHDGPVIEPHSHWHRHERLQHAHPHYPDLHHHHAHADMGALSPFPALLNRRSAALGAASVGVAAFLGLTFFAQLPQERSARRAELTATDKESPAALRPQHAKGSIGANPDPTKAQQSPIAKGASQGDESQASPLSADLTAPSDGGEAALRAFLHSEPTPAANPARFILDQVQFDVGRTTPRPTSRRQLLGVAQILSTFPKTSVFIGYSDSHGHLDATRKIVQARLISVRRELTKMGIDPTRLSLKRRREGSTVAFELAEKPSRGNAPIFLEIMRP